MRELVKVFKEAEQKNAKNELATLAKIVKGIIALNTPRIIEILLGDENYMDTFGILECTVLGGDTQKLHTPRE